MTSPKSSIEDRRAVIMATAATSYCSNDDAAQDYLAAIEGSSIEEQKQLFALVLSMHDARRRTKRKVPTASSIEPEKWQVAALRLGEATENWTRMAIRNNASLEETAAALWEELTLLEGQDRIVALGFLLDSVVVPYAKLPANLLLVKPLDVYREAHERIPGKIALVNRILCGTRVSPLELASALVKLLEGLEAEEQTALLLYLLDGLFKRLDSGNMAQGLLGLVETLLAKTLSSHQDGGGGADAKE